MTKEYSDIMSVIANNEKRKADERAAAQSAATIVAKARENNRRMQAGLEPLPSPIADPISVTQAKIDNNLHSGEIEAAIASGEIKTEIRDGVPTLSKQEVALVVLRSSKRRPL